MASDALGGWLPPAKNQAGPTCTVWSTSNCMRWWMAKVYGWNHWTDLTPTPPDILARAEARAESPREVRVWNDFNQVGWWTTQHPNTRLRAGWRTLGADIDALTRDRFKEAIAYKQPATLTLWTPTGSADSSDPLLKGQLTPELYPTPEYAHAVMAYGWDDNWVYFLNSWGVGWGQSGHGKLSWSYYDQFVYRGYAMTSMTVN